MRGRLVVAVLLAVVTPQPGTAGVSGYEVVTELTLSDSTDLKDLLVDCPAGKQLLGGGARIFGSIAGTALFVTGPEGPVAAPTSWFGAARELVATSANWGLRVDVFCGNVPGYEVVSDLTAPNSDDVKSLLVDCPAGKQLLGGGARIGGSTNGTALTTSGPEGPPEAPTAWFGVAIEVVASSFDWALRIDAICGNVVGYDVITEFTASNSDSLKPLTAIGPGALLIGGGARIFGSIDDTALIASGPEGPSEAPTEWFGSAHEVVATTNNWGLRVDAIYAPEPSYTLSLLLGIALLRVLRKRRRPPGCP